MELYTREGNHQFRPANWYCEVEWSEDLEAMISRQYRELKRIWHHVMGTDRVWHDAKPYKGSDGKTRYRGRCNDFSTELMLSLMALDIPRGALSLAVGYHGDIGHVVLIVHTTEGDLVCCIIVGTVALDSPRLRNHRFTAMEWGPHWVSLEENKSISFADLIKGKENGMKCIIAAGAILLSLGACTAGDIGTLRDLTIEDGARYVNENHERRRAVRGQLYDIEDEVIRKCQDQARAIATTGDIQEALTTLDWCFEFLEKAYPDLATFKAIREGQQQFNNLRGEP